jgi:hypothetical protein
MYLAGAGNDPMSVTNIFSGEVSKSVELFSTHEEADTRMLLHAIHADKVFAESGVKGRIIIKSPDTDALVLCVHYLSMLQHTQELWFQTGTVSSTGGVISQYMIFVALLVPFSPISYQLLML